MRTYEKTKAYLKSRKYVGIEYQPVNREALTDSGKGRIHLEFLRICLRAEWDPEERARIPQVIQNLDIDWILFEKIGVRFKVVSQLYLILRDIACVPKKVRDRLRHHYYHMIKFMTRYEHFEKTVLLEFAQLTEMGIDSVILKGPVLNDLIYPEVGIRYRADLDLIVKSSQWVAVTNALLERGYNWCDAPSSINNDGSHKLSSHISFRKPAPENVVQNNGYPRDLLVEVHTSLVGFHYRFVKDWSMLWQYSEIREVMGVDVRVLDKDVRFLSLCAHLVINHENNELRHAYEIFRYMHFFGDRLDWFKIMRLARQYEFVYPVRAVMKKLHQDWGLDLPFLYQFWQIFFRPNNREKLFFEIQSLLVLFDRTFSRLSDQLQKKFDSFRFSTTQGIECFSQRFNSLLERE